MPGTDDPGLAHYNDLCGQLIVRKNPFQHPAPAGFGIKTVTVCGVADRVSAVKQMGVHDLRLVLALSDSELQKSVRAVAASRLRKLEKP